MVLVFFYCLGGIAMTKEMTRKSIREQLTSLDEETYNNFSKQIEEQFLKQVANTDITTIGITISSFPEVDTSSIIKQLWAMGKNVVVPKCSPSDRTMVFYQIQHFDQLEQVYMHLLEPNPLLTKEVTPNDIDLLVVPGIVYSREGYRIGYGGGYYDRFLMGYEGNTLSLAFAIQMVKEVESDIYDLPVDQIITPNEIFLCKQIREKDE